MLLNITYVSLKLSFHSYTDNQRANNFFYGTHKKGYFTNLEIPILIKYCIKFKNFVLLLKELDIIKKYIKLNYLRHDLLK